MNEIYETITAGWLYQKTITGNTNIYNIEYVNRFNTYIGLDTLSKIRYDLCNQVTRFNSVLDVGYGNGAFIQYCLSNNKRCYGNDISGYPIPKGATFVDSIQETEVDLITFFDSLEHFPNRDLDKTIKALRCKFICISVPWCHYTDNMKDFEVWKHRKPNEHFHHFDLKGLCTLLDTSGFNFVTCGSVEDLVRKGNSKLPNILTVIGQKK